MELKKRWYTLFGLWCKPPRR